MRLFYETRINTYKYQVLKENVCRCRRRHAARMLAGRQNLERQINSQEGHQTIIIRLVPNLEFSRTPRSLERHRSARRHETTTADDLQHLPWPLTSNSRTRQPWRLIKSVLFRPLLSEIG